MDTKDLSPDELALLRAAAKTIDELANTTGLAPNLGFEDTPEQEALLAPVWASLLAKLEV